MTTPTPQPSVPQKPVDDFHAWFSEFSKGLLCPQPVPYPSVQDWAETRIRQIDREIEELQSEKRKLQKRLENP